MIWNVVWTKLSPLENDCDDGIISDNEFFSGSHNPRYCIYDYQGEDNAIHDNAFEGFVTGAYHSDGASDKVHHNVGFVTENSGSATISDSTSTTFAHGLAGQPDYLWASFNSTAYNGYTWTANSTHATITVGTSGNYTAYWWGIYEP